MVAQNVGLLRIANAQTTNDLVVGVILGYGGLAVAVAVTISAGLP